jgi:hypothetical protein
MGFKQFVSFCVVLTRGIGESDDIQAGACPEELSLLLNRDKGINGKG